ncbi:hypothetical protein ACHAWC_007195 [Mediolabrus comicus]
MATPAAEAHLAKLQSLRRKHMSTDRESAKEDLMHQRQSSPPPFAFERKPGQRKSHVMKKRSRQHMTMQQQSRPPPPPPPCPRYVEVDDENDTSYNSSFATPTYEHAEVSFASSSYSSATSSSVSIDPHTSNIQRYRQYIQELSRGLEEEGEEDRDVEEGGEEELCAEELDVSDLMSLEQQNQSQRGSGHYNSRVKDNMIEEHYHLQESGGDLYSEESSYYDEEACLSSNNMQNYTSNSNFRVPAHVKLNPRANLYLLMAFTNIIAISSLAVGTSASRRQHAAFFFSASSLVVATALSCAFRYAPTRMYITQPYLFYEQYIGQVIDSREKTSSIVLLLCTFVVCGVVMNPVAGLGVAPNYEVLNQPLFYSTWVSLYTALIVVADLFTLDASRWIIARDCGGDCGLVPSAYRPSFQRRVLKKWVLVLFSNFAMSVALFDLYASGMCEIHCKNVMSGGIIALGGALIGIGVLALHHVVNKAQDRYQTYGTRISCWEGPNSQKKLNYVGTLLAIVVVVINCTAVGLVCTHLSGPGSAVLTCWVALIVSTLLCKLYIGYFFVEKPQNYADDNKMNEVDVCCDEERTRTTLLDESLEINDDDKEDNGLSFYEAESRDEMMDRLKTLSVSAHMVKQEEESSEQSDVANDEQQMASANRADPIKDSICSRTAEDCNTRISTARKITPSPPPPPREPYSKSSEGNRNVSDEIDPVEQKRKQSRSPSKLPPTRSDGSVRLSGKDSAAIDDLVAKALLHATRTKEMAGQVAQDACSGDYSHHQRQQNGVVSDSEESRDSRKEQRRACRTELTDLIDKLGREKKEPPQYISHIFSDSSRSRSHSSSRSRRRSSSRHRSSSRRRSISID